MSSSKKQSSQGLNKKECEIANEIGVNMPNKNANSRQNASDFARTIRQANERQKKRNEFADEFIAGATSKKSYSREQEASRGNATARSNYNESKNQPY